MAAVVAAGPALAEDSGLPDPSIATSLPPELADPGGVRSALGRAGASPSASTTSARCSATPAGGFKQGTFYDGRLEVAVSADLEKMIGWKGLSFFANGYQIHGESITGESLGSLMPVSFIEATPSTRLFEMWFEQKLLDDKLSIRFGQIAADSEFILSDGGGAFINGNLGLAVDHRGKPARRRSRLSAWRRRACAWLQAQRPADDHGCGL